MSKRSPKSKTAIFIVIDSNSFQIVNLTIERCFARWRKRTLEVLLTGPSKLTLLIVLQRLFRNSSDLVSSCSNSLFDRAFSIVFDTFVGAC